MSKNHLSEESSPYLLQHQNNPVHWYPWNNEAFQAAKDQDKPLFLSIGYSTCYWCHVMEKDSFERDDVAEILNENFIAIKVDREERPDVDAIYMDAVVGLTGHGGWPMSVFLTGDLKPFWGGTYFPRDQFISILKRISEVWANERKSIFDSAEGIANSLASKLPQTQKPFNRNEIFSKALEQFQRNYDEQYGGFGSAPKFPPSQQCRFLIRYAEIRDDKDSLEMATNTLLKMAKGGIYDHIGGGFHRYSVDEKWLVPHFEKMLYDNALLLPVYSEAYVVTKNENFSLIAKDIARYLLSQQNETGGFYSAEDAGEVGKEGEFYVWNIPELTETLESAELQLLQDTFEISNTGNFEGSNILTLQSGKDWSDRETCRDVLIKLEKKRSLRERPHLDDKILTSWNGLTISALSVAGKILNEDTLIQAAVRCAQFLRENLFRDRSLYHRWREGVFGIPALLEDYAYLLDGLVQLYKATNDNRWKEWAEELSTIMDEKLYDPEHKVYRSSTATELFNQKYETIDGATPSGNSMLILPFLELSKRENAERIMSYLSEPLSRFPTAFSRTLYSLTFDNCLGGICTL